MLHGSLSTKAENYLCELIKRKVISEKSLLDQTLIHYLRNIIIDEDYLHFDSTDYVKKNRRLNVK